MRPLGLASIPVIVATSDSHSPVLASRHAAGRLILPASGTPELRTVEALLDAGAFLTGAVGCRIPIFYGVDETLSLLCRHREALSKYYAFLLNDAEIAAAVLHKGEFDVLTRMKGPQGRVAALRSLRGAVRGQGKGQGVPGREGVARRPRVPETQG